MKGYYTIEVKNKEGKLLKRIKRKSRSFVQQWNELVAVQLGFKTDLSIKDTGGADRDIDYNEANFKATAAAADDTFGIVVGTGSTAVTIADYALDTICAEGTGADELNYHACSVGDPSVAGSDCSFTVTRSAINSSGSAITIAEIGLQLLGYDGEVGYYFLAVRDVLAEGVEVPDGGAISVVYTLKVTV